MGAVSSGIVQEEQPFAVAWRTVDGLRIRHATNGRGGEKIVLFSPWPESIFAFAPVWGGLTKQFEVLAIDLPGFGDRKSTRLNSSHLGISYAVFCLKKKKQYPQTDCQSDRR